MYLILSKFKILCYVCKFYFPAVGKKKQFHFGVNSPSFRFKYLPLGNNSQSLKCSIHETHTNSLPFLLNKLYPINSDIFFLLVSTHTHFSSCGQVDRWISLLLSGSAGPTLLPSTRPIQFLRGPHDQRGAEGVCVGAGLSRPLRELPCDRVAPSVRDWQ